MTLFDLPTRQPYRGKVPRVAGSPTSAAAAESIAPDAATLRQRVYDAIAAAGATGRTDSELQSELGMDGSTERPRRRELQLAGRVRDSGAVRMTGSGRMAAVWVVNEKGQG